MYIDLNNAAQHTQAVKNNVKGMSSFSWRRCQETFIICTGGPTLCSTFIIAIHLIQKTAEKERKSDGWTYYCRGGNKSGTVEEQSDEIDVHPTGTERTQHQQSCEIVGREISLLEGGEVE